MTVIDATGKFPETQRDIRIRWVPTLVDMITVWQAWRSKKRLVLNLTYYGDKIILRTLEVQDGNTK